MGLAVLQMIGPVYVIDFGTLWSWVLYACMRAETLFETLRRSPTGSDVGLSREAVTTTATPFSTPTSVTPSPEKLAVVAANCSALGMLLKRTTVLPVLIGAAAESVGGDAIGAVETF